MSAKNRAQITGHIGSADNRPVDRAFLQSAHTHFEGSQTGVLLTRQGEAGTSDLELLGHPAGNDAAERPHDPVGT